MGVMVSGHNSTTYWLMFYGQQMNGRRVYGQSESKLVHFYTLVYARRKRQSSQRHQSSVDSTVECRRL